MNRFTATIFGLALGGYCFAFKLLITRPEIWHVSLVMLVISILATGILVYLYKKA